uniref:Uncharacterized protein n=1 Tax=Cannabis sativa TaxID=3483 RepID=A0A803PK81_CANSA
MGLLTNEVIFFTSAIFEPERTLSFLAQTSCSENLNLFIHLCPKIDLLSPNPCLCIPLTPTVTSGRPAIRARRTITVVQPVESQCITTTSDSFLAVQVSIPPLSNCDFNT